MAITSSIPKLVAAQVLRTLEDNLVATKICDLESAREIERVGDEITFPSLSDPTINTYTGTVNYEDLTDAGVTLKIDQAKYFAFKVSDKDYLESAVDLKSSQASRAAYKLKEQADKYVLSLYGSAGTKMTGDTYITENNVIETLAKMSKTLREKNVRTEEMFMVMPPFVEMYLTLAGVKFGIDMGKNGVGGLSYTNELGFPIYISNELTTLTGGKVQVLAGGKNAIIYGEQILSTEMIRLQDSFDDAVRGLHVYGAKVADPTCLVTASLIEGAAPSGT